MPCEGTGQVKDVREYRVRMPAGVRDRQKIRPRGIGGQGRGGGEAGDLYVTVHIDD
ncbi:DnaJ C-terminal domain-containing protein [Streptomyces sp. CB01580]|uniref:DnaJ C-terminal domain-containing protein n=1 Tax=Streptomyces sp. CB01580 TaxID=1703933 RepID=UPI0023782356|nr:DnaJ C-terminal domain-containing protein [Streptomyces sp. CB01580]